MYTKEDFTNAIVLEVDQYLKLVNPKFEGQTPANEDGDYSMYFSSENKLYVRHTNLFI